MNEKVTHWLNNDDVFLRIELEDGRRCAATAKQWIEWRDHFVNLEERHAKVHNRAGTLLGNTQASDLDWLAQQLFSWSNLGAGDVKTVPWLMSAEDFAFVGLQREQLMGEGPHRWYMLTEQQQEAWRKLARICLFVLPRICERIGHRYEEQAKSLKEMWESVRAEGGKGNDH